jgi:hypothetical protein
MTLCIYLWDILYAIATDPGTIAMVQGFGFSMKMRGFTLGNQRRAKEVANWDEVGLGRSAQAGRPRPAGLAHSGA